jgi:hypothetical protein
MATRALPARVSATTVLPSSSGIITGNPASGGVVGAARDAPAIVRAGLVGPLGLLLGADMDLGELALRIAAAVVGVALIIAGGFMLVQQAKGSAIGKGIAEGVSSAKGAVA